MINETTYRALSADTSDYDAQDGDLDIALNLINENNAIRPLRAPGVKFKAGAQSRVIIHRLNAGATTRFIVINSRTNTLLYTDADGVRIDDIPTQSDSPILDAKTIGNMIILSRRDTLEYIWWNPDQNKYVSLGSSIPDLDLNLALDAELAYNKSYHIGQLSLVKAKNVTSDYDNITDDDFLVKSHIFPADTIRYNDSVVNVDDFVLQKGKTYQFNLEYSAGYISWVVYYGTKDSRNGVACQGLYGGSKYFVAEHDGPISLYFAFVFEPGYKPSDTDTIPHQIAFAIYCDDTLGDVADNTLVPENTLENRNAIAAAANKFVADEAIAKNRFVFPFFARFAVKLYDGSYASISQPVLLVPNSAKSPLISLYDVHDGDYYAHVYAFLAWLNARFVRPDNFSAWSNIIQGIDIFVSSPAYLYNQDPVESDGYPFLNISYDGDMPDMFSISRLRKVGLLVDGDAVKRHYLKKELDRESALNKSSYLSYATLFAPRSPEEVISDLKSKASFYHIASLDFNTLDKSDGNWFSIDMPEGSLLNLETKTPLDDSLVDYNRFTGASLHVYNSRLHVFNASAILPDPAPMFRFTQLPDGINAQAWVRVHLNSSDGRKIVTKHYPTCRMSEYLLWAYYPNPDAYRLEISARSAGGYRYWDIPLKPHDFLNGAFALADNLSTPLPFRVSASNPIDLDAVQDAPVISKHSVIYVSEVNNPFVYKAASTVSVPASRIIGLSSAAKALSQGQFGQFPLYAFSDQGVWAVEVSAEGKYTSRQPITMDVCTNPESITQLDSSVIFATDRGIMQLSGSQAVCISDTVNTDIPFDVVDSLPQMRKVHDDLLGHDPDECLSLAPFVNFCRQCKVIYDYPRQRVIFFRPCDVFTHNYAYVLSLRSGAWGMLRLNLKDTVDSYPDALAIDRFGNVVDFDEDPKEFEKQLLVTRPLKLGDPHALKTVNSVIQRGDFRKGRVQSILYGSRDLQNWHLVRSSTDHILRGFSGSPYKYFRIALVTMLRPGESISGASLSVNQKFTNRLR